MHLTDSSKTGRTCALMKKCALIRKVRLTTLVYGNNMYSVVGLSLKVNLTHYMNMASVDKKILLSRTSHKN